MGKSKEASEQFECQPESSLEQTCFTCHVLLIPLVMLYLLWAVPTIESLEAWEIAHYFPRKEWTVYVPVSLASVFVAAPILYGVLNALSAPKITSLSGLSDQYSIQPSSLNSASKGDDFKDSSIPQICDLRPSSLVWYKDDKRL